MRTVVSLVVHLLAAVVVLGTFASLLRRIRWWGVRMLDYPRLQLFVLALLLVPALWALPLDAPRLLSPALLALTLAAAGAQGGRIAPYTRLWPTQTASSHGRTGATLRLMIANVLMDNREAGRLVAQIEAQAPDLVVLTEPDAWWAEQLRVLHDRFPHRVEVPLANTYGMIVLSRLPLEAPEVRYLVEPGIPSVHTAVRLGGATVALRFVHPKPPAPGEADTTTERDAELLLVGREVRAFGGPAIVAGDLNDVAWSSTSRLFQRISGMLDPRRGRGFFSTFPAAYRPFRWPLDHVFHTPHFTLDRLERLTPNGSDHVPIVLTLRLSPDAPAVQPRPTPDAEDQREAQEEIDDARKG